MSRIFRTSIVLGIALATLGAAVAVAQTMPDAVDRAQANQPAVLTDAHQRAPAAAAVVTDSHERAQPLAPTTGPVASEPGWSVSWTNIVIAAAIAAGVVAAGFLLVRAIRRYPPRGHPPLVHR